MEVPPNQTLYLNNLNEKIKQPGEFLSGGQLLEALLKLCVYWEHLQCFLMHSECP